MVGKLSKINDSVDIARIKLGTAKIDVTQAAPVIFV